VIMRNDLQSTRNIRDNGRTAIDTIIPEAIDQEDCPGRS
jgi:hypothetical protein